MALDDRLPLLVLPLTPSCPPPLRRGTIALLPFPGSTDGEDFARPCLDLSCDEPFETTTPSQFAHVRDLSSELGYSMQCVLTLVKRTEIGVVSNERGEEGKT